MIAFELSLHPTERDALRRGLQVTVNVPGCRAGEVMTVRGAPEEAVRVVAVGWSKCGQLPEVVLQAWHEGACPACAAKVGALAEKAEHGARQLEALTADVDALRAEIAARKDARAELLALRAVAQVFLAAEADPDAQRPGSDAAEHLAVARAVLAEASREKLS